MRSEWSRKEIKTQSGVNLISQQLTHVDYHSIQESILDMWHDWLSGKNAMLISTLFLKAPNHVENQDPMSKLFHSFPLIKCQDKWLAHLLMCKPLFVFISKSIRSQCRRQSKRMHQFLKKSCKRVNEILFSLSREVSAMHNNWEQWMCNVWREISQYLHKETL